MSAEIRLAVLLSGSGRTLQNFLDRSASGSLKARVVKVVSSLSKAYGLVRAQNAGIPTAVVRKKDHDSVESFSLAITRELDSCKPDLVALAGFMCFYRVPDHYRNRVMNIHPALLPSFGGQGYYGERVHQAVLDHGCKVSGCTVHFVDNVYDHGPIIVQKAVPVLEDDDAHTLADRVFAAECEAYPEAINLFAEGRLRVEGSRVRVLPQR
jgi:phosphoribosylglycinamide formyltransferase-1